MKTKGRHSKHKQREETREWKLFRHITIGIQNYAKQYGRQKRGTDKDQTRQE